MGELWGGLFVLGLIMSLWLFGRLRTRRDRIAAQNPPPDPVASPTRGRRSWGPAVVFTLTAAFLPWSIGLGVKIYLDAVGRPTLPVAGFLEPLAIPILILLTFGAWSFPFLVLASAAAIPWRVGFAARSPGRDSTLPLWSAYAAGVVAAVPVFVRVFWEFDSMLLLVPVGTALIPPMALGYLVGVRIVGRRRPGP